MVFLHHKNQTLGKLLQNGRQVIQLLGSSRWETCLTSLLMNDVCTANCTLHVHVCALCYKLLLKRFSRRNKANKGACVQLLSKLIDQLQLITTTMYIRECQEIIIYCNK